jgi:hypothetical protein
LERATRIELAFSACVHGKDNNPDQTLDFVSAQEFCDRSPAVRDHRDARLRRRGSARLFGQIAKIVSEALND